LAEEIGILAVKNSLALLSPNKCVLYQVACYKIQLKNDINSEPHTGIADTCTKIGSL
jgi:hypothetical protein